MIKKSFTKATFSVVRKGLKWVVYYELVGHRQLITNISFWSKKKAQLLADIMLVCSNDAYIDTRRMNGDDFR